MDYYKNLLNIKKIVHNLLDPGPLFYKFDINKHYSFHLKVCELKFSTLSFHLSKDFQDFFTLDLDFLEYPN